ncbi:hypothetical protein BC939DRAFT_165281 [Gamsiella multidivaricata]|uniref:uncharacterized protein n=1 Tax=Gamsiella multidivaricata TaxID=101098 RepID=UPI00221EFE40|nr:uncharacterized protein BC939DRAFT_165281 [Gamsiella multidivaricata]KAG0365795.1 hypothetical protein BGZ54_006196 [Gamsiella multidivaricata]KAI7823397.1 hypothetical protein BC939DRAFT_165281 [Gamsiella multidivaricata]
MLEGILRLIGAWGAFGLMGAGFLGFSIFFTLYYSNWQDREPFAMLVTVLALTLCLTTVALFPVDIFLVSTLMDPATGLRYEWATDSAISQLQLSVKIIYYVAYGLIASFCFFWIPLAYFYFEELADENQTTVQKVWSSLKYTIFFVLVACTLLLTGLLMKPDRHEGIDLDWLRKILKDFDGSGSMAFVSGVLALVGMGILVFYTAPGLSLLPLHLLAGSKLMQGKSSEINVQLAVNRERQNIIMDRYQHRPLGGGGRPVLSDRDRQAMAELAQEELMLESRSRHMRSLRDSLFHRCQFVIRPFQVLVGLAGSILSLLLIVSILITSIGQTTDEICGASCGYIFIGKDLPNLLNLLFLKASPYFPIDYVLMVMVILYMFWATTKGIISIGIRVLWVNLYEFKRAATQPQGLLAATMLLMLSLAGLSYSLTMSVAPEYSMFGSQSYCNNTMPIIGNRDCSSAPELIVPCHIGAPPEFCVTTVTSSIILTIILATPSLGIAFFYMQWLFLASFALALLFNFIQGCRQGFGVDPFETNDDDLDEMEARGLLSGELNSEDGRRRVRRRGLLNIRDDAHEQAQDHRQAPGLGQGHKYGYGQHPAPSYGAAAENTYRYSRGRG